MNDHSKPTLTLKDEKVLSNAYSVFSNNEDPLLRSLYVSFLKREKERKEQQKKSYRNQVLASIFNDFRDLQSQ